MGRSTARWVRQRLGLWREYRAGVPEDGPLHGVRGLAVLIVIASHTKLAGLDGQGGLGVWLFFVLSGFLLAQTFLDRPHLATSPSGLLRFYLRRLLRLLPAYMVCVVVLFAPFAPSPWAFLEGNLLPIDGFAHLWSVKQELMLYCLLPVVMLPAPLAKRRPMLFAGLVLAAGLAVDRFVTPDRFSVYGNSERMAFYAFPFFCGISAASFCRSGFFAGLADSRGGRWAADIVSMLFFAGLFLSATSYRLALASWLGIPATPDAWVWSHLVPASLAATSVVLAAQVPGAVLTGRIFGWAPLQVCGLCGYGLYLIHPFVFPRLEGHGMPQGVPLFVATSAITLPMAVLLYSFVERMFWRPRFAARPGRPDALGGADPAPLPLPERPVWSGSTPC